MSEADPYVIAIISVIFPVIVLFIMHISGKFTIINGVKDIGWTILSLIMPVILVADIIYMNESKWKGIGGIILFLIILSLTALSLLKMLKYSIDSNGFVFGSIIVFLKLWGSIAVVILYFIFLLLRAHAREFIGSSRG
ncbi:hypothetical protein [Camelimonas lactis]|uniref:hypothetical protein n=1 Tax=Camelimonas lactis TaxID=659006 RepID=UPI00105285E9|nr:hypothetical protein [Camelimonas lactis]